MKNPVNYDLVERKRWTEFLTSLPVGTHTVPFPDVKAIRSCKVSAYNINSDGESENCYYFTVNKKNKMVTIKVVPRTETTVDRSSK